MAHAYLVEEKKSKKRRLIEASAPANAIAHCAKAQFTAQRVEGAVLDALKGTMELETIKVPAAAGEAPAGDGDGGQAGDGDGKDGEAAPPAK